MREMILIAVAAMGCGGDSESSTQQGDCGLDIAISGGYSWKNADDAKGAQLGCGSTGASGTSIGVEVYGPDEDELHEVRVLFLPALAAGALGDTPATVVIDAATTGIDAEWRSAVDGCNFKITKNQHEDDSFFMNKYVIGGTVECAAELTQSSGTTVGSINVNNFKFQAFDDYSN